MGLRDLPRYAIVLVLPPKADVNAARTAHLKAITEPEFNANSQSLKMPTGTVEFKCIRINLERTSTFEPDERQIDSLIEFDLTMGDERLRDLRVEVRQLNGTDFQRQPLEVGNIFGYNGSWNYEEFRECCERYYRDVIGSCGMGLSINRGERNLIERVAIQRYRREEINLPPSGETVLVQT